MSDEPRIEPVTTAVVGPLCRYFAGPSAGPAEAATRVSGVETWRSQAFEAVGERVRGAFDWQEDPAFEPIETPLGRGLDAVRLLAVYAQRTELELPDRLPARLDDDPALASARAEGFAKSHYGHLLAAACWLPADFDFTFVAPRPDGEEWMFGSLAALCDQLHFLDERSFAIPRESWSEIAAESLTEAFVPTARVGIVRLRQAAEAARAAGQVLALREAGPA